jgi:hypothetical protein
MKKLFRFDLVIAVDDLEALPGLAPELSHDQCVALRAIVVNFALHLLVQELDCRKPVERFMAGRALDYLSDVRYAASQVPQALSCIKWFRVLSARHYDCLNVR